MKSLEEIRNIFKSDRYATESGAIIEAVGENYAKCSLEITEKHLNATGALMGGVPFVLADFTFAVAANAEKMRTVSLGATINYVGAAKGNKLFAEANCIKNGRSTCLYNIRITDNLGTVVADVSITGFNKNV